jgi:hypothetical protein
LERKRLGALPRNFSRDREFEARFRAAILANDNATIRAGLRGKELKTGCHAHMPASAVKEWVSPEFWNRAVKIAGERHPYEKAVSLAHFSFTGEPAHFAAHLDETVVARHRHYACYPVYMVDGEPVVDEWILYDALQADADRIATRLGLPTPLQLPRARSHQRADRTPAPEVLTPRQKRIVQRHCAPEFDLFGWER